MTRIAFECEAPKGLIQDWFLMYTILYEYAWDTHDGWRGNRKRF